MFNLDRAIEEWRRQMQAAGITDSETLHELEGHLRDDVEQQAGSGLNAQQTFVAAVKRIGEAQELKTEFVRAGKAPVGFRKLMGFACVTLVCLIFLLSGFTFLQMQMSLGEQILAYTAVAFTLAAACGLRHTVPFLPVISNKRKRMAVGSACILFGILCTSVFTNFILPHFERDHDGQIPAVGFWAVFPIAVFTCLGLGLMMSARDREYWRMKKAVGRPTVAAGS